MKKGILFILIFLCVLPVCAEEKPEQLYAQSAVLMDADTGRVLFEKNARQIRAMASTTKIMTCIVALEYGDEKEIVTFSKNAKKQPKVHLGAAEGEQFVLADLLYSLMLESHNDSAVAIAETVSGSVEAFVDIMNQKAKEIGCENTYFITPNGLDDSDENGKHSTNAIELGRIMSYCIKKSPQKERFLEITSTLNYQFQNIKGTKTYNCNNHNLFLNMMEEAVSGKTGFTSDAGYCYVGAVESEGRTFVVALLGCGWPNHKNYKWEDMKTLIKYGMNYFEIRSIGTDVLLEEIRVKNGIPMSGNLFEDVWISVEILDEEKEILMHEDETCEVMVEQDKEILAPIKKGDEVGKVTYLLNDQIIAQYPIVSKQTIGKKNYRWTFSRMMELYLL